MSNNKSSTPNTKMFYAPYPYPVRPEKCTMENQRNESTHSNNYAVPSQTLSPYLRDQILKQGRWKSENGTTDFQQPCIPSAPFMEGNPVDQQTIQFTSANTQFVLVPIGLPPPYDRIDQKYENYPKITERRENIPSTIFSSDRMESEPSTYRRSLDIFRNPDDSMNQTASLENQYICFNVFRVLFWFVIVGLFSGGICYYIFKRW